MKSQMTKLTSKGQLTLPKSLREQLSLDKGSCIAIYLEKDMIVMKKVNSRSPLSDAEPTWDMVGMLHDGYGDYEYEKEGSAPDQKVKNNVIFLREPAKWRQF